MNWNRADDTIACVRSLEKQSRPIENIIVIENGSDEEPSFISRLKKDPSVSKAIDIIETGKNLGFGAGANVGIKRALSLGADYILVINNDTIADPAMLEKLLLESKANRFGISAPLIYYHEAPNKVWSSGGNICKLIGLPFDAHHRKNPPIESTRRTFLTGCCLLLDRKVLETVGFFDEGFFMYYEDLDLMARTNAAKVPVGVVPSAKLWHKEAQSSGGYMNPNERYWSARSLMRYSKRVTKGWNAIPLWAHRLISMGLWTLRLLLKRKPESLKAYWQGIRDGLFNKSVKEE